MTNITLLIDRLELYVMSLQKNRDQLDERHNKLKVYWERTYKSYRGQGADAYAEALKRSGLALDLYVSETTRLLPILEAKIDNLRRIDQSSDPLV